MTHTSSTPTERVSTLDIVLQGVTLTPELWLVKLMVGAIDPSYDEQDE